MRAIVKGAAKFILVLLAAVILGATNDHFLVFGSWGEMSRIVAPELPVQFVMLGVFAATILAPARQAIRALLLGLGVAALGLGSHRLYDDTRTSQVQDVYFGITIQTLPYNGDSENLPVYQIGHWGIDVMLNNTNQGFWVFSPPVTGLATWKIPRRPAT